MKRGLGGLEPALLRSKLAKTEVRDGSVAAKFELPDRYALLAKMYEGLDIAVSRHQRLGMSPTLESLTPSVEMVCQRYSTCPFCNGILFFTSPFFAFSTFLAQHVAQILTIEPGVFMLEWSQGGRNNQLLVRVRLK
jgi:hypothetical protein